MTKWLAEFFRFESILWLWSDGKLRSDWHPEVFLQLCMDGGLRGFGSVRLIWLI